VGIFSLFGKKERQPADAPADKSASRKKREPVASRVVSAGDTEITKNVQRKAARATAMKIDAIESEMSSEFVRPLSLSSSITLPGPASRNEPVDQPKRAR
jgi:hypothetical protein